jgi:hypothetical protein
MFPAKKQAYYYLFELKDHKAMQDWLRNGELI